MPTTEPPAVPRLLALCLRWVAVLALLVPRRRRAEWREEWEVELCCRWERLRRGRRSRSGMAEAAATLLSDSAGALADALWLLRNEGRPDMLAQDLRLGLRALVRDPAFAAVAVLTLAVGIGATTAVFSVVDAVVLRPLALPAPERLVALFEENEERGWRKNWVAPANYLDWQARAKSFSGVAAYHDEPSDLTLAGAGSGPADLEPEPVKAQAVSAELLQVLGVRPVLGRGFRPEENWRGPEPVVLLGHGLWKRRFGGDPRLLGRTIRLNGREQTVVGVLPPGFDFPGGAEMYTTFGWDPAARQEVWFRRAHFVRVVARLAPGVSLPEAGAELAGLARRLEQEHPETNTHMEAGLMPLHEWVVGDTRRPLLILLGAVALVLLTSCANVANLLLSRASARNREMAVRSALGAGRLRLTRQLLTEGLVLAGAAGLVGMLFARWGLAGLLALAPADIPRLAEVGIDARVLLVAAGTTLAATLFFGLAPAVAGALPDARSALLTGGRGSAGPRGRRTRGLLVVAEVALALLLVTGAGLLVRSFQRLLEVEPGFDPAGVLVAEVSLPGATYAEEEQVRVFYERLLERVRALPGVVAAATTSTTPLRDRSWTSDFAVAGRGREEFGIEVHHAEVDPEYFRTLGIRLVRGRGFTAADGPEAPPVILINQALADRYFRGQDPLGQRLAFDRYPDAESRWYTIVGVTASYRQGSLAEEAQIEIYRPQSQDPGWHRDLLVRASGDPRTLVGPLREALRSLDRELTLMEVETLEQVLSRSVARERFLMLLLTAFGAAALLLAAVGTYGVVTYAVQLRTAEIGIRMALGAGSTDVLGLVVGQGMTLVLAGFALGLLGSLGLSRVLSSQLFGITAGDPWTYAGVSAILVATGLLASYLPARRAARLDPVEALRRG